MLGGIRPESSALAEHGIPARVRHAEYLGADTVVACTVGDVPLLARLPGRVVLADGTPVCLATDEPIHMFDAASGRRIEQHRASEGDGRRMIRSTRRRLMQASRCRAGACRRLRARPTATEISFYFPVAVGGPITKIIDGYAADFQRENPSIKVTPIYAGTYQDTLTKAQTALKANAGPQLAVLLSTDAFSLIDDDLIVPFDTLASSDADRAWLRSFYPAFLKNGEIDGHTWGVPFQRSTIVLFWNKAAFQDAGLDPERPPATWDEHAAFAEKLTKRSGDAVGAVGRADSRQRLSVLAVPGTRHRGRRHACQCRWHGD